MIHEQESSFETPRQKFESAVVEPTRKAMEKVMAQATSKEDAVQRIKNILPQMNFFLGPMVIYRETGEGEEKRREIFALVQTLDEKHQPFDIEAHFVE